MGRVLLIALALVACSSAPDAAPGTEAATTPTDPHGELACAACHQGERAELGRAAVPRAACAASGCHEDGGPVEVELATARFRHRNHARNGDIEASCAGCHTHASGEEPLVASVDACAVCHLSEVAGAEAQDCRLCHTEPSHVQLTSQGVPVPHSSLPWIETGCVRCHYDVAEPPVEVSTARCAACHEDLQALTRAGIGEDLHPAHLGNTCTACHEAGTHRVRAMSSAVDLVCADCHRREHGIDVGTEHEVSATCGACHRDSHAAQQSLLLGILPGDPREAAPSTKFLAGLTCRSCHIEVMRGGIEPIRGQARSCQGCHRDEYAVVLDWWIRGLDQRLDIAGRYVDRARRDVTRPDSARALVERASAYIGLVREAGGQHNLELSDQVFRQSLDLALQAYRAAGQTAPVPPHLGTEPHAGLCSYCHYRLDEPWNYDRMSEALHQDILEQTRNR